MSTTLYYAALVLHIIGITMAAGTSFIDFITFNALRKIYLTNKIQSIVLEGYLSQLQRYLGIGMLLILVSGIAMMVKLHEVWGAQLWFRVKMGILLLVIINGLGIRRVLGKQLTQIRSDEAWNRLKVNFTIVQLTQLLLFVIIFILSVFKFN